MTTWILMMIGMMAPSALPFLTTYAVMLRRRQAGEDPVRLTAMFFFGYSLAWALFSALAALLQVTLQATALLSTTSGRLAPVAGGAVFLAAGAFQWTPVKHACLRKCSSPVAFLVSEWREGAEGACRMGLHHGFYCLGCCWLVMLLPFAAGVMNIGWMVGITVLILLEKVFPGGERVARFTGAGLSAYAVWTLVQALN